MLPHAAEALGFETREEIVRLPVKSLTLTESREKVEKREWETTLDGLK